MSGTSPSERGCLSLWWQEIVRIFICLEEEDVNIYVLPTADKVNHLN